MNPVFRRTRAKVLALAAILLVAGVTAFAVSPLAAAVKPDVPPGQQVRIGVDWQVNVTAAGMAVHLADRTGSGPAALSFTGTVLQASPGGASLNVTAGQLTLNGTDYPVEHGHARLVVPSGKLIAHVWVTAPDGTLRHLILHGDLGVRVPAPFEVSTSVPVDFAMPQSKLAGRYFLAVNGTLHRTG